MRRVIGADSAEEEQPTRGWMLDRSTRLHVCVCFAPDPLSPPFLPSPPLALLRMSASSSLSRLEFVLSSSAEADRAHTAGSGSGGSGSSSNGGGPGGLVAMMPTWLGGSGAAAAPRANGGGLPQPAGGSSASASGAAASASALASSAAASASHAAARVSSKTSAWFGQLSSKVTGREYVPASEPAVPSSSGDIEEGSTLLPSSDPGGATSSLASAFSSELSVLTTLSWRQRLMGFGFSLAAGSLMLGLAFMYLPLVFLGAPAKFALSYALGNAFLIGSSLFLVGPAKQLAQMFAPGRSLVSAVYLSSLVLLFYVSWQWRSFLIVVPVLVVQVASLTAYLMSYIPFGQAMLARIWGWTVGRQLSALTSAS